MLLKKLSLIVLISLISACSPPPIGIPIVVSVQKAPVATLPPLTKEQKESIREDVFLVLVQRELLLKKQIETQNTLIDNHNKTSTIKD